MDDGSMPLVEYVGRFFLLLVILGPIPSALLLWISPPSQWGLRWALAALTVFTVVVLLYIWRPPFGPRLARDRKGKVVVW